MSGERGAGRGAAGRSRSQEGEWSCLDGDKSLKMAEVAARGLSDGELWSGRTALPVHSGTWGGSGADTKGHCTIGLLLESPREGACDQEP